MNQETIQEAAEKIYPDDGYFDEMYGDLGAISRAYFIEGAEWQSKRMYSEEDLKSAFRVGFTLGYGSDVNGIYKMNELCNEWFKQYINKL